MLPTPPEVDAPGLWLARIDLPDLPAESFGPLLQLRGVDDHRTVTFGAAIAAVAAVVVIAIGRRGVHVGGVDILGAVVRRRGRSVGGRSAGGNARSRRHRRCGHRNAAVDALVALCRRGGPRRPPGCGERPGWGVAAAGAGPGRALAAPRRRRTGRSRRTRRRPGSRPRSGIDTSTGMKAPTTHTIWNRVSNLANDRPRLASGASRCTSESKASLPLWTRRRRTAASSSGRRRCRRPTRPARPADRGDAEHDLQDPLLGDAAASQRRGHQRPEQRRRRRWPPAPAPNCQVAASLAAQVERDAGT